MLKPLNTPWDYAKAAHLLNRAGFGGTPSEIEALQKAGMEGAVEQLLSAPADQAQFPPPDWAKPQNLVAMAEEAAMMADEQTRKQFRQERQKEDRNRFESLVTWWIQRMRHTPNPLQEKMTLFWHGHFATSSQKVRETYYMWLQNETLRRNALRNFGNMVKEISRDPAMLIWLDTNDSLCFKPNENFGRELMELFTLGIGNYTEQDVQQAARAFTGYKINPANQAFRYAPLQHDDGEKTFLGQVGKFTGDDVIDIILEQRACSQFMARKLWTFFAYENPSQATVDALAETFRKNKYEIRPTMKTLLTSAEFYSDRAMRTQIKSPVQWLVGTAKLLEVNTPPEKPMLNALRQLGQVPFMPPNVKGWDGGKAWISTSTLLQRYNLASYAVGNGAMHIQPFRMNGKPAEKPGRDVAPVEYPDFAKLVPQETRKDPKTVVENLTLRLFQSPLTPRDTEPFHQFLKDKPVNEHTLAQLVQLMMSTPQYQLA